MRRLPWSIDTEIGFARTVARAFWAALSARDETALPLIVTPELLAADGTPARMLQRLGIAPIDAAYVELEDPAEVGADGSIAIRCARVTWGQPPAQAAAAGAPTFRVVLVRPRPGVDWRVCAAARTR